MGLREYKQKRNFKATPEPAGKKAAKRATARFVVQKHAASHLHYDFRLEVDGVLKSWAVPKGPTLDPGVKRLAVEVEDHPLDYADFEGNIPQGQYGGGSVIVWDTGTWSPAEDADLSKGKLKFTLRGKKLKGDWALVRLRKPGQKKPQWLLFKESDKYARRESDFKVVEEEPASVLSGRTIEDLEEPEAPSARPTKRRRR